MSANPTTRVNVVTFQIGTDVVSPLHPEDGYWFHTQEYDSNTYSGLTFDGVIEMFDYHMSEECEYIRADSTVTKMNDRAYKSDLNYGEEVE